VHTLFFFFFVFAAFYILQYQCAKQFDVFYKTLSVYLCVQEKRMCLNHFMDLNLSKSKLSFESNDNAHYESQASKILIVMQQRMTNVSSWMHVQIWKKWVGEQWNCHGYEGYLCHTHNHSHIHPCSTSHSSLLTISLIFAVHLTHFCCQSHSALLTSRFAHLSLCSLCLALFLSRPPLHKRPLHSDCHAPV
jgi:hypothetical protein